MGFRSVLSVLVSAVLLFNQGTAEPYNYPERTEAVKTLILPDGYTPSSAKLLGRILSSSHDWYSPTQFKCLNSLWYAESRWLYNADNKYSSAYGIAQVLNTPTTLTPRQQIKRGLNYIDARYGNPCKAWTHFKKHDWY